MNHIRRLSTISAVLILFSGLAISSPVLARADSSSGESGSSTSPTDNQGSGGTGTSGGSSVKPSESTDELTQEFKDKAKTQLETVRQNVKEHTTAQRQKACEARKTSLTKRMDQSVKQAQKHKAVFDQIYTKVKAFHDNKNLNVADYDSLTAAVDTAQANAQASIDALDALQVNVDCTSQTVADSVATFQQAVKSSRDSLKTYRSSIVDLVKALKGASASTDKTSTDSSTDQ